MKSRTSYLTASDITTVKGRSPSPEDQHEKAGSLETLEERPSLVFGMHCDFLFHTLQILVV
jgi:hypothetical protein